MNRSIRIDDPAGAIRLADLLNGAGRTRPVVVVTIASAQTEPFIDVESITRDVGDLADVYLMPTGPFSWRFSERMAEGTQVYGGAGRVYPVGREWAADLSKSPLRFAFNAADGARATELLVSDALRMVASVPRRTAALTATQQVVGTVRQLIASRGIVDIGRAMPAFVAAELTAAEVPIDRILTVGQRVMGRFDPQTARLDLRGSMRSAVEALKDYQINDVVLTKATLVRSSRAELVLYPAGTAAAVVVTVSRDDVTLNPNDDLRTLLTVGEVVPARVTATGPNWSLILNDIDDDEPIVSAPALLDGGPPWLIEEPDEPTPDLTDLEQQPNAMPAADSASRPSETTSDQGRPPVKEPAPEDATPAMRRPTPSVLDRNRATPSELPRTAAHAAPARLPVAAPPAALNPPTKQLLLQIDGLKAHTARLERQLAAASDTHTQLRYLHSQAERRADSAEAAAKKLRAQLRKASGSPATAPLASTSFADRGDGFRHIVHGRWATRIPVGEQAERPLRPFTFGPRFFASLDDVQGVSESKVADVVVEVVTGLAESVSGRRAHRLRRGSGGNDPAVTRRDGAVCWRVALQVESPSARRLHYWALTDGSVELSRVVVHDDYAP